MSEADPSIAATPRGRAAEVFAVALRLGLTSFGGPIAHFGYFERVYVRERRWLTAEQYSGLLALCQMLPGPASSQAGFLVGMHRAGWAGALAAWVGFTLPSALLMFAAALLAARARGPAFDAVLHGLKLMAVAVVAQAVWSMARRLCFDRATTALALAAAALLLVQGGAGMQLLALGLGALGGALLRLRGATIGSGPLRTVPTAAAWTALAVFFVLLLGLPLIAHAHPGGLLALAEVFYRAGALVFGGGHVVLPLLRDALVPAGWMTDDTFLAGYGLAQAVPGPLFTVTAFLGAATDRVPAVAGALVATVFVFLPGLLLATAGVSLWSQLARHAAARSALVGIDAAVVGILGAALYDPVWTSAVRGGLDVAVVVAGFALLERWRVPPLAVLALCLGASLVVA